MINLWIITIGQYNAGSTFEKADSAEKYVNELSTNVKNMYEIDIPFPDRVIMRLKPSTLERG